MMNVFDYIILGGGPAAAFEAQRLSAQYEHVCLVSDSYGGCMSRMRDQILQSYCHELQLAPFSFALTDYLTNSLRLSPTGKEYAEYIKECILSLPAKKILGEIEYIDRNGEIFECGIDVDGSRVKLYANNVVLATGIVPRPFEPWMQHLQTVNCFTCYEELATGRFERYHEHDVLVCGSGNTAFQLAANLSSIAKSVTILGNRYLGIFPQETENRFALRAPSQLTIERIIKSMQVDGCGELNSLANLALIRFLVYRAISHNLNENEIQVEFYTEDNLCAVAKASFAFSIQHQRFKHDTDHEGVWRETFCSKKAVIVSARGVLANIPKMPWESLVDRGTGYLKHNDGQTAIEGLYVAGSCAGYNAVNNMKSPNYSLSVNQA